MENHFANEGTTTGIGSTNDTIMYEDNSNNRTYNKVLLIEDNPGDARLVELLLAESDLLNCKITNKVSLAEGITALEEEGDFAAILLDLTLPDSRGFETLERLLEKHPDNNVIVLTGLSDKSLGLKAVKAGAQDFLIKGAFDSDLLAKSLRYSIERSSVLKRLEESQKIAHIGNWEFNPQTKEFTASDEVYRIFGFTARKTIFTYEDITNAESPAYLFNRIHEATLVQKSVKEDIDLDLPDGSRRYIFVQCSINKNIRGETVLNGILQDITERKEAEREMVKSQERYQDIFTQSKDAIYICTMQGKLVDFNEATAELFGSSSEELRNEINIHDQYQSQAAKLAFLEQLTSQKAVQDFEIEIVRKDGEQRYCLITASLLDTNDFVGYNGIIRDITERKQAERLRKARDLARQSAMMKEQFIASISHEMRTPMNAVLGMSNLLLKTDLNQEQFNYIGSIKQSSEILLGIINDILEISTLQNGKLKFEHAFFDLHELLANMINVMHYKMNEKNISFELAIDPDVPRIMKGDKLRLNQILYNLVGNAVKFTDEGFVNVRVKLVGEATSTAKILFEVEDSGIGIPSDKLAAIFETFTRIRTKERIYEGTGLGLSIAKNLVDQQGGKIGVESEMGAGSKFHFSLTFEIGKEEDLSPQSGDDQDGDITIHLDRPVRLLLVEDHKMNQLVARKTLERQWEDIQLTIADNGQIAIDKLKAAEQPYDIILMDIQMPIMDGYETTKYIREKMPAISKMPILAMTAHAHISKDEKFKEYGMDDFVLKPFEPNQLFSKIAKYINRSNDNNE
ncbi:MAG: response regulator [Bacteroidota bacterium]